MSTTCDNRCCYLPFSDQDLYIEAHGPFILNRVATNECSCGTGKKNPPELPIYQIYQSGQYAVGKRELDLS